MEAAGWACQERRGRVGRLGNGGRGRGQNRGRQIGAHNNNRNNNNTKTVRSLLIDDPIVKESVKGSVARKKKIGGAVSRVKWLEVVRVWRRKSRGTSGADRVGRRRARHWIVVRWRISCKVFSFLLNPRKRYWLLVVLFVRYSFFFPVCFV